MKDKAYALVTGASSGIGTEIARQLAGLGHPLIITARRKERLDALKQEIEEKHNLPVVVIPADLGDASGAKSLFDQVMATGNQVGILINNAGFGMQGYFLDMEMDRISQMFMLNMNSLTQLTLLFGKEMKKNGGGFIMQVASAVALSPSPMVSAYAGSKAYVLAFSETIRYELKKHNVSVTTLYPGITTTEFNEVAEAETPGMMKYSVLSAQQVAKIGIRAMFKKKRAKIPGVINNINAFFSKIMPRGLIINSAGKLMESANK